MASGLITTFDALEIRYSFLPQYHAGYIAVPNNASLRVYMTLIFLFAVYALSECHFFVFDTVLRVRSDPADRVQGLLDAWLAFWRLAFLLL